MLDYLGISIRILITGGAETVGVSLVTTNMDLFLCSVMVDDHPIHICHGLAP